MSNDRRETSLAQVIHTVEPSFNQLAKIHGAVNFKQEESFALQIMKKNSYLAGIATKNLDSLKEAVINVAAIGLSLSPVDKFAYLVPRDGRVCLDISYRGYVALGIKSGGIKWAKAEIVHKFDTFKYKGMNELPRHEFDPFGDERGEIKGCYCVAKTPDGEYMVTMMPIKKIFELRDRSAAWKAYVKDNKKRNPWVTDEEEMIKKTVIRRAQKDWPMVTSELKKAVHLGDEQDPIDVTPVTPAADQAQRDEDLQNVRDIIEDLGKEESKFVQHLETICARKIEKLEDLTDMELNNAVVMLESMKRKNQGEKK